MTDPRLPQVAISLPARISRALASLWAEHAGEMPSDIRTEIQGNMVTCRLVDSVGAFERATLPAYRKEAIAAVAGLTRQRVTSFVSSHDGATDVATEVFHLEPSLRRGRPRPLAGVDR